MNIAPIKVTSDDDTPITYEIDRAVFNNED